MQDYRREFIDFAVRRGALRFGEFTLKSGRKSPYFFNSGAFDTGEAIERLGYFYAHAVLALGPAPDVIFGPAYKGIPLAVATASALATRFGAETAYCFDRKERKEHGEEGMLVGRVPKAGDRVVLVDDVITDGATKMEAVRNLREWTEASIAGLVIALDRKERGRDGGDPVAALEAEAGIPVRAVASVHEVIEYLAGDPAADRIREYLSEFGV